MLRQIPEPLVFSLVWDLLLVGFVWWAHNCSNVALDQVFQAVCQEAEACDDVWNCPADCFADGNSNDEDVLGKCCQVLAIVDGLDLVDVWLDGVQHGGLICGDSHNLGR